MSTYCISDIHGEYERYISMLEHIKFSDRDTLYVLGDCIDRKPDGIRVLQDIMSRPNVHLILGNHEAMMLDSFRDPDNTAAISLWKQNGGGRTRRHLRYRCTEAERRVILNFVSSLPDHLEINVAGSAYYLVHGYPGFSHIDRIWGRPESDSAVPIIGKTAIIGHTPTVYLHGEGNEPFRIYHGAGFIDIDCGCGNETPLRRLACLRLDDMAEFYV